MSRNSTRPPGSTLTTSGSPSVRSFARNASYLTSFKSGLAAAPPMAMPGTIVPLAFPFTFAGAGAEGELPVIAPGGMPPSFLSPAKIWSGGVKLKSASIMMTSCWPGRSR